MTPTIDRAVVEEALARASDTWIVRVGGDTLRTVDTVFAAAFGDSLAVVVADATTYAVAGQAVLHHLQAAGRATLEPFIFARREGLHAHHRHVVELQEALGAHDAIPVAVGSGTVNDLTKLAAHRCDRPYMVVATAASMDGYTAFGASITDEGFKQTFACPAPRAVLADLGILAAAPPAMTASGYADLLGKVTAGADWLVADALGIEPIDPAIWAMVQGPLRAALGAPERLPAGDREAVEQLFLGLTVVGLAMQAARSSRPASGSEHQFSHLWEMGGLGVQGDSVSHGFKVGIGSIAVAALYEQLLASTLQNLDIPALAARWPSPAGMAQAVRRMQASPALISRALEESRAKYLPAEQLAGRLALLRERWPALRERLQAQLLSAGELRRLLAGAGCPADPADIGLTRAQLAASYEAARRIRRRYTVLDLAAETGLLESSVAALFRPGGYWAAGG